MWCCGAQTESTAGAEGGEDTSSSNILAKKCVSLSFQTNAVPPTKDNPLGLPPGVELGRVSAPAPASPTTTTATTASGRDQKEQKAAAAPVITATYELEAGRRHLRLPPATYIAWHNLLKNLAPSRPALFAYSIVMDVKVTGGAVPPATEFQAYTALYTNHPCNTVNACAYVHKNGAIGKGKCLF